VQQQQSAVVALQQVPPQRVPQPLAQVLPRQPQ